MTDYLDDSARYTGPTLVVHQAYRAPDEESLRAALLAADVDEDTLCAEAATRVRAMLAEQRVTGRSPRLGGGVS